MPTARRKSARVMRRLRAQLVALYGETCAKCGAMADLTLDHVVPRSADGVLQLHNLQLLCQPCNLKKGAKHVDYRPFHPSSMPVPKKVAPVKPLAEVRR